MSAAGQGVHLHSSKLCPAANSFYLLYFINTALMGSPPSNCSHAPSRNTGCHSWIVTTASLWVQYKPCESEAQSKCVCVCSYLQMFISILLSLFLFLCSHKCLLVTRGNCICVRARNWFQIWIHQWWKRKHSMATWAFHGLATYNYSPLHPIVAKSEMLLKRLVRLAVWLVACWSLGKLNSKVYRLIISSLLTFLTRQLVYDKCKLKLKMKSFFIGLLYTFSAWLGHDCVYTTEVFFSGHRGYPSWWNCKERDSCYSSPTHCVGVPAGYCWIGVHSFLLWIHFLL